MNYFGVGTILKIIYNWEGQKKVSNCILAMTFDEQEVFQIIETHGDNAGYIKGYIERQFNDYRGHFCTWEHLEQQLRERVFGDVQSIQIIEERTTTQKQLDKISNMLKRGGFKTPFNDNTNEDDH